jgi:PAS domain S-box-containing protein
MSTMMSSSVTTPRPVPLDGLEVLSTAVEKTPQGVLILSEAGTIVASNDAATALLGYARNDVVGRALSDVIPDLSEAGHPGSGPQHTATGLRADGVPLPIEVSFGSATVGGFLYRVLTIVDLTDRLNLEARLMAATNAHLGFQHLVADIALQIARAESIALDDLITDSLRQIGESLQLDRAILWRKGDGESVANATHFWIRNPHPSPPGPMPIGEIPFTFSRLKAGEPVWFSHVDEIPDPIDRSTYETRGPRSGAAVPLSFGEPGVLGALALSSMNERREWVPGVIERLRLVAGVFSQALARRSSEASLTNALDEIHRLRDRLADGTAEVRREAKDSRVAKASRMIVADSAAVKRALVQIEQVAATPATVLLRGDTGTGKEVFAQAIHDMSPRHQRPMVVVSCAAIPTALIESELFGRERGAYTGALSRQIGRFEAANGSTLFLDEIGELPMEMQVKLLRVLQQKTIERLGSTQPIKVDVRIIAATHRDLEASVREGTFREDLFYRLNVFPVIVPPLRERVEDIPGLVWSFIDEFSRAFGKSIDSISKENMKELQSYQWPGNVRELRNVIERAVILSNSRQLVVPVPRQTARMPQEAMTLEALEVEHIRKVLESTNWRVRGSGGAAERLGLKPTTLESRMARLGIARKRIS